MSLIVEENLVSFKTLEKEIFRYVCELGCQMTQYMLERNDKELADSRDKQKYRDKGVRKTTIKTVYGKVYYAEKREIIEGIRNKYQTNFMEEYELPPSALPMGGQQQTRTQLRTTPKAYREVNRSE